MKPEGTLLLDGNEIAELLTLDESIAVVEQAFRLSAQGKVSLPDVVHVKSEGGMFHIKSALITVDRTYFAAKANANFFGNSGRFGLPNIQGVILLCDGETGYPLAIMDSIEITIRRTGAATAVAAKYLARSNSRIATICGCGNQGRIHARALKRVRPIEKIFAFDTDRKQAEQFAAELSTELQVKVTPVTDPVEAIGLSQICVTCTPSRRPFVKKEYVAAGTFVAAVGADSPEKQELDPALLASTKVVVDVLEQCATMGELHHALIRGYVGKGDVHAELGEVVDGQKPGRESEEEVIIFDSTGTALQDAAAAVAVYQKALKGARGLLVSLSPQGS
jgi:alanine dehydrogenase